VTSAEHPADGTEIGHVHGHSGHAHADVATHPARGRAIEIVVGVIAVATLAGLVALWPPGDLVSDAGAIGLDSDRFSAKVTSVTEGLCSYSSPDRPQSCRAVSFTPSAGPDEGRTIELGEFNLLDPFVPDVSLGDDIVVGYEESTDTYFYADLERRPALRWLVVLFVVGVIVLGRIRGVFALGALAASLAILLVFYVPAVVAGTDPTLAAMVGAATIGFVALYATHGFGRMTTVAVGGVFIALACTVGLAVLFFDLAAFSGGATEEAAYLPLVAESLNVRGLLLGGVVIGALGALDDVVITQAATVWELRHVDRTLPTRAVVASAMRVGRNHIGSIVNTLLLAYAGAATPLLVLFVLSEQSLGTIANSEIVAIEIVRTLVGSLGLLVAVPATTWLAAWVTDTTDTTDVSDMSAA